MAQLKVVDQSGFLYIWQKILAKFVAKESGKGLSSNDYTTAEKEKLAGLSNYTLPTASTDTKGGIKVGTGLEVDQNGKLNVTSAGSVAWSGISNKPEVFPPDTHTHAQSDITGLSDALAAKAASDHTHTAADVGAAASSHTHAQSDVTGLSDALAAKIASSEKGANSGVATLNASGKLTATQIPSDVVILDSSTNKIPSSLIPGAFEDVVDGYYDATSGKFYEESTHTTEMTGVTGRFYVDLTLVSGSPSLVQYRYSGSAYVPVATYVSAMSNGEIDTAIAAAES